MGWDYVGRLRNNPDVCRETGDNWETLKKLYRFARSKPVDIGRWTISRSNPVTSRIVAYRKRKFAKKPEPAIGSAKSKRRRKMKEPWLLTTSLQDHSAKQIANIYRKRMQIEETFRDAKNHRFGWSFRHARSNDEKRFEVMLLIATLAMLIVTILGNAAEKQQLHYKYQANTIRSRRVLSLFFLGVSLLNSNEQRVLSRNDLNQSCRYLRQLPERIDD